jgi:hypothetical protein
MKPLPLVKIVEDPGADKLREPGPGRLEFVD